MKANAKLLIIRFTGLLFAVLPPIVATLSYFPLWKNRGTGAVISGIALLFILLSLVPLAKLLKRILSSPTAYTMWFVLFVLFFFLSKIADEMAVISFVGFLGNLISALIWRFARRLKK